MSEPKLTDAQIVDWLIRDMNDLAAHYDAAHASARFDVVPRLAFTVKPGERITRTQLVDYVYDRSVNLVIKELKK